MLRFLRLPVWMYFALAVGSLPAAFYFWQDHESKEADKATALSQPPPAPVTIQAFDPVSDQGPAAEVEILAQAAVDHAYTMTRKSRKVVLIPLFATDALSTAAESLGAIFELEGELTNEELAAMVVAEGPMGPILAINGVLVEPGRFGTSINDALRDAGIARAQGYLYVDPFRRGRESGLAPSGSGPMLAYLILGFGAVSLAIGLYRRNPGKR